jgi:hypothetical protein
MPISTLGKPAPGGAVASSGPLTAIAISPDLACSVTHVDDDIGEFFGDTACGTFVAIGGEVYGPTAIPGAESFLTTRPWSPLAQTVSGQGTREAPYTIRTSVGTKEFQLTEVDTYVVGDDAYRTDLVFAIPSSFAARTGTQDGPPIVIYHAGDCRLESSEFGLGSYTSATGAITCHPASDARTIRGGGHVEQFVPITPGSDYLYSDAADVWSAVAGGRALPDAVRRGVEVVHNAIGLSWTTAVLPTTVSFLTSFAKVPVHALPTSLVLGTDAGAIRDRIAVTARIENPNVFPLVIDDLTATLPPGASYVPGSVDGIRSPRASAERLDFGTVSLVPGELLVFGFAIRPNLPGQETLELAGVTRGGPPVLPSRALLRIHAAPSPTPSSAAGPSTMSTAADATALAAGAVGAAMALFAGTAAIAAVNSAARRQRRLVRRHVRLDPHQATVIRIPPHPDLGPSSPTFRLEGQAGAWAHHAVEEES